MLRRCLPILAFALVMARGESFVVPGSWTHQPSPAVAYADDDDDDEGDDDGGDDDSSGSGGDDDSGGGDDDGGSGGDEASPLTCTGSSPSANCNRKCPASCALAAVVTIAPPASRTIA